MKTLGEIEANFLREHSRLIKDVNVADMGEFQDAIAKLAYRKAEQRGFEPGHELPDWLAAEKEIKSMIASAQSREAV